MKLLTTAEEICARLLQSMLTRKMLPPTFEIDSELIDEVKRRLSLVGYELAMKPGCEYIAARRKTDFLEEENVYRKDFNKDLLAMIAFLYSKLVAPKYLLDRNEGRTVSLTYDQIWPYFSEHMNEKHFKIVLGTLRNREFIKMTGKGKEYIAGPGLELLIDEKAVVDKLVESVLFKIATTTANTNKNQEEEDNVQSSESSND